MSADRPEMTYEQAREELVEVVRKLEAGGTSSKNPWPSGNAAKN